MNHAKYLKIANDVAKKACAHGNTPFGAVLVNGKGEVIMEQGNAEKDLNDKTAHAERMLASRASQTFRAEDLWDCTLYTTVEPCPMCTGAIYWSNIGKIVYGITESQLLEMTGSDDRNPTFHMGADKVIAAGQKDIQLEGPVSDPEVTAEIVELHRSFW